MAYLLLTIGIVAAAYFIGGTAFAHSVRSHTFSARESRSVESLCAECPQCGDIPRDIVSRVWTDAAIKLRIDPTKLRSTDRFDVELSHALPLFPFVDLNDEFYWWTVDTMKRTGVAKEVFENAKTFGEYVAAFACREA